MTVTDSYFQLMVLRVCAGFALLAFVTVGFDVAGMAIEPPETAHFEVVLLPAHPE